MLAETAAELEIGTAAGESLQLGLHEEVVKEAGDVAEQEVREEEPAVLVRENEEEVAGVLDGENGTGMQRLGQEKQKEMRGRGGSKNARKRREDSAQ